MTRTTLINIGIVIAVVFVVVVITPLITYSIDPGVLPDNHIWINKQYHQLGDGGGPGTGFWYVLGIAALVTIGMLIWILITPYEPDEYELFDRWDGRQ
jgi:hypothetical protein